MPMSPRIKAKKGRFGPAGLSPTMKITSPADGFAATATVPFAATGVAIDPELGDVSASIVWTSDLDGVVGASGGTTSITLTTVGTHVLTGTATDGTNPAVDSITVTAA